VSYTLNQWDKLIAYLDCSDLTPDNNISENAIRPFVVGRKNWLFYKSPEGAETACILYSVIETAKLNGLNPLNIFKLSLNVFLMPFPRMIGLPSSLGTSLSNRARIDSYMSLFQNP
jgi:hypothetical protein